MKNHYFFFILIALACASPSAKQENTSAFVISFSAQTSNTTASLRGLSVADSTVAWASGQFGTVLRTINGGQSWEALQVPDADSTDFRDIHAFDSNTALLLSAGSPGLIYKTSDGGRNWESQYKNTDPDIFFDAFDFRNELQGMAMSDPVEGHFVLLITNDGGTHWDEIPAASIPEPAAGEAGFAASGTGVVLKNSQHIWFATGGTKARVFRSASNGSEWEVADTPMIAGAASTGIFSLVFMDLKNGAAVGGDYVKPDQKDRTAIYTGDGGRTWQLAPTPPSGYRSGVAYAAKPEMLVCVGPTGSDYSADGGVHWLPADTAGYHNIQFAPGAAVGWATGGHGKIAKVTITNPAETD